MCAEEQKRNLGFLSQKPAGNLIHKDLTALRHSNMPTLRAKKNEHIAWGHCSTPDCLSRSPSVLWLPPLNIAQNGRCRCTPRLGAQLALDSKPRP